MDQQNTLINQFDKAGIRVEIQPDSRHWKLFYQGIVAGYWPNTGTCYVFGKSFKPKSVEALIQAFTAGRIKLPAAAAGAGASECRNCGASIWWLEGMKDGQPTGKKIPVEATGEAHFSNCGQADLHRKPAAPQGKFAHSHRAYQSLVGETSR